MRILTLVDIKKFGRRSLREKTKDVWLLPIPGEKPALVTHRAPGCKYVGAYNAKVSAEYLLNDVLFVQSEEK